MYRFIFLSLLLTCFSSLSHGQFRAIQSSAGGLATSATYSTRATIGESIGGSAITSNQDRVITGFYLMLETGVDAQGPRILFVEIGDAVITPVSQEPPTPLIQPANAAIPIATQITDSGSGVLDARLFYRQGGASSFTEVDMLAGSGVYTGSIDGSIVNEMGLEYYIVAEDSLNNTSRVPATGIHSIQVRIDGLDREYAGDSTQLGYRLIGSPMELANASSNTVLADLLPYNNTNWRLWELKEDYANFTGEDQYQELSSGTTFNPGDAFWIISRNDWTQQTGEAVTVSTKTPFVKRLNPGWNFISNPYNFAIPLRKISLSSGAVPDVQSYQRGWSPATSLSPFTGYAIDAGEGTDIDLILDPDLGLAAGKSPSPVQINSMDWGIQISAESNIATDHNNFIGVNRAASAGWDIYDQAEPPVIGDYVSVSFPHDDWGKIHRRYKTDIRPIPSYGEEWQFDVLTGSPQTVTLTFDGVQDIPSNFDVQLIDEVNKTILDLRDYTSYTVRTAGNAESYPLTINIGEGNFIEEQVENKNLRPDAPTLDQNYPNPFNPTTSIRYGLTGPSTVTLEIYNSLGQVVSTLVNHVSKEAGYHVATWDALADDGSAVSSGLYLYRLSVTPESGAAASPTVLTRKMMLIK